MNQLKARLDALRGSEERKKLNARGLAALTTNPSCQLRSVLDTAGIDKQMLCSAIGFAMPADQSQFAITRGTAFEAQVKANGCAQLLTLLRDLLGLPLAEVSYDDLETVGGNASPSARHRHTVRLLTQAGSLAEDAGTLFDHPMLELVVAGHPVHLEPDLIAFRFQGRFFIVEIKSFAVVDGQAPAASVAAAELQSAVYVHAMRELLRSHDLDEQLVSPEIVLVCPQDFSNKPTAVKVDITNHLNAVRRQLSRMKGLDSIVAMMPAGATLDRWRDQDRLDPRPAEELKRTLRTVEAHYIPQCLSTCEMAKFCRREERGSTAALGRQVREDLGGLELVSEVIGLATGARMHADDQAEQARLLRLAHSYRAAFLGGAA
ncbi:hypothetical protein [Virgisporangium aurantiacum]|uniref:Secreted protein n=1 Tax=Virgisporangium aurantiacum TaxID=175570 RepID=A0A8J3ZI54_9ACTN|nr:hypothetical protein [Virgisporangium aurantiacum]GIJ64654.1 hypothetical protein Vau01_121700 [Virgisporangium aurantiacum]